MRLIILSFIFLTHIASAQDTSPPLALFKGLKTDIPIGKVGDVELKINIALPKQTKKTKKLGPRPILVLIHGGGLTRGDKNKFNGQLTNMAQRGIASASVMYRFAPEYRFPAAIEDVQAAIRFLKANAKTLNLDPERIIIRGGSAGGYLANMVAVTGNIAKADDIFSKHGLYPEFDSSVRAVISQAGAPADFTLEKYDDFFLINRLLGHDYTDRQALRVAMSPITYLDKNDPPFYVSHGTEDKVVPISMSREFTTALKALGIPTVYREVEGAGHSIKADKPREAKKLLSEMMAFFTHFSTS